MYVCRYVCMYAHPTDGEVYVGMYLCIPQGYVDVSHGKSSRKSIRKSHGNPRRFLKYDRWLLRHKSHRRCTAKPSDSNPDPNPDPGPDSDYDSDPNPNPGRIS